MRAYINREFLWSDTSAIYVLTVYTEGLACNNFDKKTIYNVRRHNKYTWYVLKKSVGEEGELNSTNQLSFYRVRMITVHDGYMSCSCDGV